MSQKRIRSTNWDEKEKKLLCSILKNYTHILENKCLNTKTNNTKIKAWDEVYKRFNEINTRHRALSQLRLQWKRMKMNARKSIRSFKKQTATTGGGTRPSTPDDITNEIEDLLNPAELIKDHSIYDSDGYVLHSTSKRKCSAENISISKKDPDYRTALINHFKHLKDENYKRRLAMAEEEHAIKMKILEENLQCSIIEKEIMLLKKEHHKKLIGDDD